MTSKGAFAAWIRCKSALATKVTKPRARQTYENFEEWIYSLQLVPVPGEKQCQSALSILVLPQPDRVRLKKNKKIKNKNKKERKKSNEANVSSCRKKLIVNVTKLIFLDMGTGHKGKKEADWLKWILEGGCGRDVHICTLRKEPKETLWTGWEKKWHLAAVGFEPTPPKRLEPKSSALDHSATLPTYMYVH